MECVDVAANGDVTSTNTTSFTTGHGSLAFNTSTVDVTANGFDGKMRGSMTAGNTTIAINDATSMTVIKGATWGLDNGYTGFTFDVDGAGNVTRNYPDSIATTGTDNVIELLTSEVVIDNNGYGGILQANFEPDFVTDFSDPTKTVTVINDQRWGIGNGAGGFTFTVDAAGNVSTDAGSGASIAITASDTVQLQTATVTMETNGFEGILRMSANENGGFETFDAPTDIVVIKDQIWSVGNGTGGGAFSIFVDENGHVTPYNTEAVSATGTDGTFSLNTVTVDVDPDGMDGLLRGAMTPGGGFIYFDDTTELVVIDDMAWSVSNAFDSITFDLDPFNGLTSLTPESATIKNGELTFGTVAVEVDPLGFTGSYVISGYHGGMSGVQEFTMIEEFLYSIAVGGAISGDLFFTGDLLGGPIILDLAIDAFGTTTPFEIRLKDVAVPAPLGLLLLATGLFFLRRRR